MSHLHIKPPEATWGDHGKDDNRRLERFLGRDRVPTCPPRDKAVVGEEPDLVAAGGRGPGFAPESNTGAG